MRLSPLAFMVLGTCSLSIWYHPVKSSILKFPGDVIKTYLEGFENGDQVQEKSQLQSSVPTDKALKRLQRQLGQQEPGIKTLVANGEGAICHFPFTYGSKSYSTCTTDGMRADGLSWCATTANYNTDKKFGFCPSIKTQGGNANGAICHFPFKYGKTHSTCITEGRPDGLPWCATTSNYDRDMKYGLCPIVDTFGGNSGGAKCVFPFIFSGVKYYSCTTDGASDGSPWCATTANYDKDKKYGLCPSIKTQGGNGNGAKCHFPFMYGNMFYSTCITEGRTDGLPWCATTANYNTDKKYGFCPSIKTQAGSENSAICHFPFMYGSTSYSTCITKGRTDGRPWCATTSNYNTDMKYGFCPHVVTSGGNSGGEKCVFPFIYGGVKYYSCTTDGRSDGYRWCATTANYDTDLKYGLCPNQAG